MSAFVLLPPDDPPALDGSRTGGWWFGDEAGRIVCNLCPRGCTLRDGDRGFCFVRENRAGRMVSSTYGRSTGFCIDPIEKKPLNHFYPGSSVLSFGTAGCNLGCRFCQNWSMSKSRDVTASCEAAGPQEIAAAAQRLGCRSVAFTYNDPIVWAEYAIDTARACRRLGVKTVAVTSGYINPVPREAFYEHIDAANVDLKAFSDDFYRRLAAGHLEPVLDTLRWLVHQTKVWVEITNLVIPQANDSPAEIEQMCRWIVTELGPGVPLHFSAFHPDFKLTDRGPTPPETLAMAHDIARQAGLRYVYTGNVVDARRQATYCHACGKPVIARDGYVVTRQDIRNGCCTHCGTAVAGRFDDAPGAWCGRRVPVRIADFVTAQAAPEPQLTVEQQQRVFRAAGARVAAAAQARQPEQSMAQLLGDAARVPVYGAFVSLKTAGRLRGCCGFLGQNVPMAEALDHAALRATRDDPRFPPVGPNELAGLDMEVWLLWGLQPMAARGAAREGAIVIGRHGLQISRGENRGLLLPGVATEHGFDARQFLEQVCLKAGLPRTAWLDDDTVLMTFEGRAISGHMPGFEPPQEVRAAAVAGMFYPGTAGEVRQMVDRFFTQPPEAAPETVAAAMVPHAGWIYSGQLAASVLARTIVPETVVVLCPKHRPGGSPWAVAPHARWEFPGGCVTGDAALARRLAAAVKGLALDAVPHFQEHAIEVQLPLLARRNPQVCVVGITIGGGDWPELQQFAAQFAAVLAELPERPLLLISSDMNHFRGEAETRQLDRLALDALESLDPARLFETVERHGISMCGMRPAAIVLETLRRLGALQKCQLVGYTTSAAASGDTTRVVGYAGALFN